MDLLLLHSLILIWVSSAAARKLSFSFSHRLLVTPLLIWSNCVLTGLILSIPGQLGNPIWYFSVSVLLVVITSCAVIPLNPPANPPPPSNGMPYRPPDSWVIGVFSAVILPMGLMSMAVAWNYLSTSADSLSTDLPRTLYYLGQNTLAHFDTTDLRQIYLPFNGNLLHLFGLIYDAPGQILNGFNLIAWGIIGLCHYQLCRHFQLPSNASLLATLVILITPATIAQASSATLDLPATAALLTAGVLALHWKQTRQARHAILAGLAAGLALGSNGAMILFAGAMGLFASILVCRSSSPPNPLQKRQEYSIWMVSILIAATLALPFALIDLFEKARWARPMAGWKLHEESLGTLLNQLWNGIWAPHTPFPALALLNEDTAGFGPVGLLALGSAVYLAWGPRAQYRLPRYLAWSGLAWLAITLGLQYWLPITPRHFLPGYILLGPCLAVVIKSIATVHPRGRRIVARLTLSAMIVATIITSGKYLASNSSRSFTSIWSDKYAAAASPRLSMLLTDTLSRQNHINIESNGIEEPIYPLMMQARGQTFTSRHEIVSGAYHLLARTAQNRGVALSMLDRHGSHYLIPVPDKKTAGVEDLLKSGHANITREYFGIPHEANSTAASPSNQNILLTVYRSEKPGDTRKTFLKVAGLNPADNLALAVRFTPGDGKEKPLATFHVSEKKALVLPDNFEELKLDLIDSVTQRPTARISIPYHAPAMESPVNTYDLPDDPALIFASDLVTAQVPDRVLLEGLMPSEGPYPQWGLPVIRSARQPRVRIRIPTQPDLVKLRLDFSVGLHERNKAGLEIRINDQLVKYQRLEGPGEWFDHSIEFPSHPSANIIEFRDAPLKHEPDWRDYLERYPDVKRYLVSQNMPLEAGAIRHYETDGKKEGRTMLTHEVTDTGKHSFYYIFRSLKIQGYCQP